MVKNTGETSGAGPIRSLNLPTPVRVEEDETRRPAVLTLRRRRLGVSSVEDMWEITDEWWRTEPIARRYYDVTLDDGRPITVFRDLVNGDWYRQRG